MPSPSSPRRWLAASLTLLAVGAVAVVVARRRAAAPEQVPPAPRASAGVNALLPYPVTVAPGIHLLGGLEPAAAYAVETEDGLALIDAGLDRDAGRLKKEMATLGLDWTRVKAVFLTHAHGDHSGGAGHLREAAGAKVYAGRGDAAVLRAGEPREAFFSTFAMPGVATHRTEVDVELSDEQTVSLGEARFRALSTPGHTPGSVCYLMERQGQRVLFSGDVIWSLWGATDARDPQARPLGTYAAYLAPRYRGSAEGFAGTLRRLRAMPAPQLVLPGHPRNDPAGTLPTMSQARWEVLLDAGLREMEALLARFEKDGAGFLDGAAKKLLPDLYYLGEFKGSAVYALVAASKLFLVDAPGGPGLAAFVDASLRGLGLTPAPPTAVFLTSGNPEESAGLAELIEKYRCAVVAPEGAWEQVKKTCPAAAPLTPEAAAAKGWFGFEAVALGGRGVAPVAYVVPWGGKSLLFSGRLPVKMTQASVQKLFEDLGQGRGGAEAYRATLRRLGGLKPDLWLPANPADGQNAHLYEREWADLLEENGRMFR